MKYLTQIGVLLIYLQVNAQTIIEYENVRQELLTSQEFLDISIYSPVLEKESKPYLLSLFSKDMMSGPPDYNRLTNSQLTFDVNTTVKQRTNIIGYFEENELISSLYINSNSIYYNLLNTKDTFIIEEATIIIGLYFIYNNSLFNVNIPINDKNKSIKILKDISAMLKRKNRLGFRKMIKELE